MECAERFRIAQGQIVWSEATAPQMRKRLRNSGTFILAEQDSVTAGAQRSIEFRCYGTLCRREIGIAGRQREPVFRPDGRRAYHFHGQVQVAVHLPDHRELLEVLFAIYGKVGRNHDVQLGDHGGDAVEMVWSKGIFQAGFRWAGDAHLR